MLLAGIPPVEISQTLDISARELASREDAILRKIEALPGEWPSPPRGRNRVDLDRPIPQRRRIPWQA